MTPVTVVIICLAGGLAYRWLGIRLGIWVARRCERNSQYDTFPMTREDYLIMFYLTWILWPLAVPVMLLIWLARWGFRRNAKRPQELALERRDDTLRELKRRREMEAFLDENDKMPEPPKVRDKHNADKGWRQPK